MLDALIAAIVAGKLSHRQARIALAIATGGKMGSHKLEIMTGIDRADCRRTLAELEKMGWAIRDDDGARPVDNSPGAGGETPPTGGESPHADGGRITPQGGVNHPTGGESPHAPKPAPVANLSEKESVSTHGTVLASSCSGSSYINTTTTTTPSAQEEKPLVFPKFFTENQQKAASILLAGLNGQAQALLDEVAGRNAINPIKNAPAYLRSLVDRAKTGNFQQEAGIAVADARRRQEALQKARKEADDAHRAIKPSLSRPQGGSLKAALEAHRAHRAATQ